MARRHISELAITEVDGLVFGRCPKPVAIGDAFVAGGGKVVPELNYALPYGTEVSEKSIGDIVRLYADMARGALERAVALEQQHVLLEVEQVFEMTLHPAWGRAIAEATRDVMEAFKPRGVHAAMRTTVADIRDRNRPPRNRSSRETELILESFDLCAPYSDVLAIESTGGKEVSDHALLMCDLGGVAFALGVLASRDMQFLWDAIVEIAERHGKVAGGDAACGFANTAMQLAHKRMIPGVLAAVVRAAAAPRSLVAVECGATGPDKDCAYEGPILKAIAGIPISMEGKSAACAHSSPVGNVAMCCCDLWSNESVPYTPLFGGQTPEVSLEQLAYDCRLANAALESGQELALRDLLAQSDARYSPQALVLTPESCLRTARAIVAANSDFERTIAAAGEALDIIEEAVADGRTRVPREELPWLETMRLSLEELRERGEDVAYYLAAYPHFAPEEYGLAGG